MALLPKKRYTDEEMEAQRQGLVAESRGLLSGMQAEEAGTTPEQQAALAGRLQNAGGINDGMRPGLAPNMDLRQRALYTPEGQPGALPRGMPAPGQPRMQMGGEGGETMPLTNQQFASGVLRGMADQGGRVRIAQAGGTVTNTPLFLKDPGTPQQQAAQGNDLWQAHNQSRAGLQSAMDGARMGANIPRQQRETKAKADAQMQNDLAVRQAVNERKIMEKVAPAQIEAQAGIDIARINAQANAQPKPSDQRQSAQFWQNQSNQSLKNSLAPDTVAERQAIVERAEILRGQGDEKGAQAILEQPFSQYESLHSSLKRDGWFSKMVGNKFKGTDSKVMQKLDEAWAITGEPMERAPHRAQDGGANTTQGAPATGLSGGMPAAPAGQPAQSSKSSEKATPQFVSARIVNLQSPEEKKSFILDHLKRGSITKEEAKRIATENGLK